MSTLFLLLPDLYLYVDRILKKNKVIPSICFLFFRYQEFPVSKIKQKNVKGLLGARGSETQHG